MRENDAGERNGADILGADVVALLRRGQQRVQHLDRRLEHFDELEHALVGAVEAAGVAVGVGIVLREGLELADVDLADKRGDILVVLVAGLGLGDGDLPEPRRLDLDDAELRDIAAKGRQAFVAPGRHQTGQITARNAVFLLDHRSQRLGLEQTERAFEHRADFVAGLENIDRVDLHQRLETLGQRGLAAADRAKQIENLFALFEALRRMPKEGDDALDGVFHAVEGGKRRIAAQRPVQKNTAKAWVLGRVDHLRFADRR